MTTCTSIVRSFRPAIGGRIVGTYSFRRMTRRSRVRRVYEKVRAARKLWIIHEEYGFGDREMPSGDLHVCEAMEEGSITRVWNDHLDVEGVQNARICVDVTGFMRPQLLFFLYLLVSKGIRKFDVIYAEPNYYRSKDETTFSSGYFEGVRQVFGFEGVSDVRVGSEVLIIGGGYETQLVEDVADEKDRARKVVILGLPSLRADMYQQSAWRTWLAEDALDGGSAERHFAPAADAFATATVLSELVARERARDQISHTVLGSLIDECTSGRFRPVLSL